jgi:hypothetical protein
MKDALLSREAICFIAAVVFPILLKLSAPPQERREWLREVWRFFTRLATAR